MTRGMRGNGVCIWGWMDGRDEVGAGRVRWIDGCVNGSYDDLWE